MLQENISKTNDNFEQYKERISNFSGEFELGLFIHIARKSLWWVIGFFLLSWLGAFMYLRYTQPVFESSSVIQLQTSDKANKILNVNNVYENSDELAEAIELLRSKVFFERVLSTLPLQIGYYSEGTFKSNELYLDCPFTVEAKILDPSISGTRIYVDFNDVKSGVVNYKTGGKTFTQKFITGRPLKFDHFELTITIKNYNAIQSQQDLVKQNAYYFTFNDIDRMVRELYPSLEVKLLNDAAKTIQISFKDFNPKKAADIVTKVTEEYKNFDTERKTESSKGVLEFIDEQLDVAYSRLKVSESSIQDFRKQNQIVNNQDELKVINTSRLNDFQDRIIQLDLEENVLKKIADNIKKSQSVDTYKLIAMLAGTDYESKISGAVDEINKMLSDKEATLLEATPNNEAIKNLDQQILRKNAQLSESINAILESVDAKKNALISKSNEFASSFANSPDDDVEFGRLQRLFEINEKYYTLLLEKKTEYSISKAGLKSQNVILETAQISGTPVSPNKQVTIIVYSLIAVLLSLGLILFRYLSHNQINSLNEITKHTQASIGILGIVPKYRQHIPVSQLLIDKSPKSLVAEAFRSIRTNLQFISNEPGPKIVALTSTISGEGKTFVAINLAGIIAFSGKKVIILDLDMRKPKIHIGFNAQNSKGMSTLLINKDELKDAIQQSSLEGLDFITAGPIPPNPSELIISPKMEELLETLKAMYDVIIVDNPPVGLVSDGIAMIQKADYPIYIFRADYSKRNFIQIVDRLYNESNIKHLSVILNGVDVERKSYGYNYGYGYGYGYGYYDDNSKRSKKEKE